MKTKLIYPLAITMWDFSWLERHWPGAGYEDWDTVLDELCIRGYDAIRIDAYPHLVAVDPLHEWELIPVWNQQVWGSPALNRVRIQPHLTRFLEKCASRRLRVGLSSWFRQDRDNMRLRLKSATQLGSAWVATLDTIATAGLLDTILYVDLCNEFPLSVWAPYWNPDDKMLRASAEGQAYMQEAIAVVRAAYPQLDYCFSFTNEWDSWREQDVSSFDLMENHIWMAQWTDFFDRVEYHYPRFEDTGYERLVERAEILYRSDPAHWHAGLQRGIELNAEWSRVTNKPLITTECWAVVDYKDWPLLKWDWIKEVCAIGVQRASETGRWMAIATSNFCGPQFVGMWRDIDWHRQMTDIIHEGPLPKELS